MCVFVLFQVTFLVFGLIALCASAAIIPAPSKSVESDNDSNQIEAFDADDLSAAESANPQYIGK